ncbi:Hypothetical predicted protein [Mytilus galloprovincialis]|uniref:Uncharacterized protein n=1 Tax=Mytilus galloprovincialis TaxID=29158 RepID=A0A8B6CFD1_MYTGA|nr:Hypothetical predicted protein [Mytilus galloprovincialis]
MKTQSRHMFYLHRMFRRRNKYAGHCRHKEKNHFYLDCDNVENLNTDQELIKIVDQIEANIKFRTSKKEQNDLIAKVDIKNVNLTTKKKSPPRAVMLANEDDSINNTYVVGDGLQISAATVVTTTCCEILCI